MRIVGLMVQLHVATHHIDTLSVMPHLVSGMNFPKNFTNLSMMSPCHCHLIFLSPVHHHHHHHHHHHYFHFISVPLQTQNLPFL